MREGFPDAADRITAIAMGYGLLGQLLSGAVGRCFTFHRTNIRARGFKRIMELLAGRHPEMPTFVCEISGSDKRTVRDERMKDFKGADFAAVLCNVHICQEGVDIAAADAVMICDPRSHIAVLLQIAGRAMRCQSAQVTMGSVAASGESRFSR